MGDNSTLFCEQIKGWMVMGLPKRILSTLCLSVVIPTTCYAVTPAEQAFLDGLAISNNSRAGAALGVTNGSVATTVNSFNANYYQYSNTAPQSSLFMGGNGDTATAGAGKITSCATSPANPDAFLQQNCDAINYMANNPSHRPQFTISPSDPNVARSRSILVDASTLAATSLGSTNPLYRGGFTGCASRTVRTPATYATEICNEYGAGLTNWCSFGTNINVNPNTNYQCDQTNNAFQTQTCSKTTIPVVTPTPYCDVAGSATGIGYYTQVVPKHYDSTLRKWIPATAVSTPYGMFNVVFGCAGSSIATVTVTIAAGAQCHAGGCNSSYYPLTLNFLPSTNASTTGNMAQNYTGVWWYTTTLSYDAATQTLSLNSGNNAIRQTVTATATFTGVVGIRNVKSWTLNNGCAAQEAAAL